MVNLGIGIPDRLATIAAHESVTDMLTLTVEQITFSGKYAARNNRPILDITERAVFKLIHGQVTLIEIAPGIDLEKDILAHMDFKPAISPDLKPMPEEIFYPEWGKLKQHIESKREKKS